MDSISRVNQVFETLRRQIAESARQLDNTGAGKASRGKQTGSHPEAGALRKKIEDKIRGLDPADPQRQKRARRAFLESVLSSELGDEMLLDQRFADMLDHIEETMRSNPELDKRFNQLMDELQTTRQT